MILHLFRFYTLPLVLSHPGALYLKPLFMQHLQYNPLRARPPRRAIANTLFPLMALFRRASSELSRPSFTNLLVYTPLLFFAIQLACYIAEHRTAYTGYLTSLALTGRLTHCHPAVSHRHVNEAKGTEKARILSLNIPCLFEYIFFTRDRACVPCVTPVIVMKMTRGR